jgi:nicotinamidase-related amidase
MTSKSALLLVDVINPLDFPEGPELLRSALPAAHRIAELKGRALAARVPVIYANDNFGRWRSDLRAVVHRCLAPDCLGRPLAELLKPDPEDYFILKPMHSAFYCTALDALLRSLHIQRLVVCGFAGNICVLFTANDAHMRGLKLAVPSDTCASNSVEDNEWTIRHLQKTLHVDTSNASLVSF